MYEDVQLKLIYLLRLKKHISGLSAKEYQNRWIIQICKILTIRNQILSKYYHNN